MSSTSTLLEYDVRFSLKENEKQKKKYFYILFGNVSKSRKRYWKLWYEPLNLWFILFQLIFNIFQYECQPFTHLK